MAEASKVSGEKYRRTFSVSSAALSCNLNFSLKKEQLQALSEYVQGKDVVVNLPTGYGKSLIYSLCPLVCDNLRDVKSKKERSMSVTFDISVNRTHGRVKAFSCSTWFVKFET